MRLFIEPSDVWLFRDGKPFSAGADHRARSFFPPNPTTIQGVIRSKVLMASGVSLRDFARGAIDYQEERTRQVAEQIGWPEGPLPKRFRLRGPFVARREGKEIVRYYPLPADVVRVEEDGKYQILAPLPEAPFVNNGPEGLHPLWVRTSERLKEPRGRWLAEPELERYTRGEPPTEVTEDDKLFSRESRFGVKMDRQVRCVEEGFLYEVEFIRPRAGVGLEVEIEGIDPWPEEGLLAVGGEARAAHYQVLPDQPRPKSQELGRRFKIYFVTPAYFKQGWEPVDWKEFFGGSKVRLVAAAVRRPSLIGGWDIAHNRQKPIRPYVPAGSVYYLETDEPVIYDGQLVTEDGAEIGFGQVLTGGWDYV